MYIYNYTCTASGPKHVLTQFLFTLISFLLIRINSRYITIWRCKSWTTLVYISQLKRYPRACGSYQDFIYLSVETISQNLWFLSRCYISLSCNDIPELVVPIRIVCISQLIRYPRACGSYQDFIYLSVDTIFQSLWFLSGFYISLSWYDIPELVVPIRTLYISQLIRYPRTCGSYQDFIYLSVDTISQNLWFLSWLYISISWNDIPELVFISGFYVSLSWNDIPELVVPIRILYISQLKRYPRACGSYQDCIYLSVDMISQSVWFLSGFYISLSSYDIPELVVPIRILYISQLIRYPRVCGFYQDFLDTGLLLARKLLNHVMLFISSNVLRSPPWLGWLIWNICVTNDHGYIPLVVSISRSFPNSWHITVFVTRLTRRVPLVEQELLTLP
jgi:hypothetical protein